MKMALTNFSIKHPIFVISLIIIITTLFAMQFPKVKFDNDPENMLAKDEPIRVFHNKIKAKYNLYDFVIAGVVNEKNPDGIFNIDTLGRIKKLTDELISLHKAPNGLPAITENGTERTIDLNPTGKWKRILNTAFRHNSNRLFDYEGNSAIIGREIISPSVVDNIKQAAAGSLKIEYLMEKAPTTHAEAMVIKHDAMNNPLYKGTLVAEDGKAICVYIPIKNKTYSYNVAELVKTLTKDWPASDKVLITGQPVAQDTFGIEMLVQMATSAPLAALAIFILLLIFFKRISLITAPMIVSIVSIIVTMGLLIGRGYKVHIMSSMIAIFLMPIAVADAVHILSEFFDSYHKFNDKSKTIQHVISHLFMPMLYTSLTTIAGFASLATTPIPPVRIFGLHVAFGVALAWVLTMTLIPAYIMLAVPKKSLVAIGKIEHKKKQDDSSLSMFLEKLGAFSYHQWKLIILVTIATMGFSFYGITKIRVNDNPVKWFTKTHPIRIADRILNNHFGGTYTAYLTLSGAQPKDDNLKEQVKSLREEALRRFSTTFPDATKLFVASIDKLAQSNKDVNTDNSKNFFTQLADEAEQIDNVTLKSWNKLADEINYIDPLNLNFQTLITKVKEIKGATDADKNLLTAKLESSKNLLGDALLNKALSICDEYTKKSFREFVFEMQTQLTAPLFKRPDTLRYIEKLQNYICQSKVVGKTSSAVDALKKASYELSFTAPPKDATEEVLANYKTSNDANMSIPNTSAAIGQVFTQLEGMKKKDTLFHLVTKDYQEANIWVQLKSGDNTDMERVTAKVKDFLKKEKPPVALNAQWAGLTYLNVVWQKKMVRGMFGSLASSFIVVLIMMSVLFRSGLFGILSMIPLTVTILLIYGIIGIVGKDYDMPVAILSAMTLGLSVDFAIHFLQRAREEQKKCGSWKDASTQMFKEPAMAISRNAITIAIGFTPLLAAPLVPYKTVGFFLATIMLVSWLATLFILPALLTLFRKKAFKED